MDLGGVVESGPVPYGMGWWISTEHPGCLIPVPLAPSVSSTPDAVSVPTWR